MNATKLLAAAMFATIALAIAGRAGAAGGHGAAHAASHGAFHAGMGHRTGMRQGSRVFSGRFQNFPYYPYYGNEIYENYDEADWGEQWTSLREDNDGPYARSTRENPPGEARMWEFRDK